MRSLLTLPVLSGFAFLAPPDRPGKPSGTVDEAIQASEDSIVDTSTPPTGSRRIDVNRWEDLLHAAELLGRPILRLHGGEGGPEGSLFYVADGPQSYVFGLQGTSVNVSRSGAFAPPSPPAPAPVPALPPTPPVEAARPEVTPTVSKRTPPLIIPAVTPSRISPPAVPDRADRGWDSELPDQRTATDLPSATVVERRIREMIHELLADFRTLPPSSERLELGTEHIQRAVDMLHLGRYGMAQLELNKAARLLREETAPDAGPEPE
jgi:hypothetical protein